MEAFKRFFGFGNPSPYMHTDSFTRNKVGAESHPRESLTPVFRPGSYEAKLKKKLKVKELCMLGSGGFGVVFVAVDTKTEKQVAVKVERSKFTTLNFTKHWMNEALREDLILKELNGNANIVDYQGHIFMGATTDKLPMYVALKTELLDYDLADVTRHYRYSWPQMRRVVIQIASAIKWMHNKGIVHHDLKPANLMCNRLANLDPSQIAGQLNFTTYKLIDFNLSRKYSTPREETQEMRAGGTAGYLSPEKKLASRASPYNPFSADDYAFAATMVTLLIGNSSYMQQYVQYAGNVTPIVQNNWVIQDTAVHETELTVYRALLQLLDEERDRISVADALDIISGN